MKILVTKNNIKQSLTQQISWHILKQRLVRLIYNLNLLKIKTKIKGSKHNSEVGDRTQNKLKGSRKKIIKKNTES